MISCLVSFITYLDRHRGYSGNLRVEDPAPSHDEATSLSRDQMNGWKLHPTTAPLSTICIFMAVGSPNFNADETSARRTHQSNKHGWIRHMPYGISSGIGKPLDTQLKRS